MSGNEHAHGPDEVGSGGVPPADRLAHLGHIEKPVELYTIMSPVSNTMPTPDDADEWVAAFGSVIASGNLRGSDGKTSMTMLVDTDPQGALTTPMGGPGIDLCRACLTPVAEPSPECPNPFNHQETGRS